jgi:hypothetical protein
MDHPLVHHSPREVDAQATESEWTETEIRGRQRIQDSRHAPQPDPVSIGWSRKTQCPIRMPIGTEANVQSNK